jgi:DNA repair protein RadC
MLNKKIASEDFWNGRKHYFFDFMRAPNNRNYIQISRSDLQEDMTYKRGPVIFFEEDFEFLIAAFSSLLQGAAHQKRQVSKRKHDEPREKGIRSWEPKVRPREKMLAHGADHMQDAELLAMLIGSGTPNQTAVLLAGRILDSVGGDLNRLAELGEEELCRFTGMGLAKSCSVMAAMELARRT